MTLRSTASSEASGLEGWRTGRTGRAAARIRCIRGSEAGVLELQGVVLAVLMKPAYLGMRNGQPAVAGISYAADAPPSPPSG